MNISIIEFISYEESIKKAFDNISADKVLANQKAILIKPNLVNDSPPPITTSYKCCEAIVKYIRNCSNAEIVIGEGCGDASKETDEIFEILGYKKLAKKLDIKLIDLNNCQLRTLENKKCSVFPKMHLPDIAYTH
ncbi:MAG: DUF362 domain-containing protein [Desulfobacterales bacterium]|nr:DUF362 domain-containing protein [Desulfobacterales bacterium]